MRPVSGYPFASSLVGTRVVTLEQTISHRGREQGGHNRTRLHRSFHDQFLPFGDNKIVRQEQETGKGKNHNHADGVNDCIVGNKVVFEVFRGIDILVVKREKMLVQRSAESKHHSNPNSPA